MRKTIVSLKVVLFVMLWVMAATAGNVVAEELVVSVDIYSGQPNPTFTINNTAQVQKLTDTVAELRSSTEDPDAVAQSVNRLGYRGILINNSAGIAGLPAMIRIYGGYVMTTDSNGAVKLYADSGLEKKYLSIANRRGLITDLVQEGFIPDPAGM